MPQNLTLRQGFTLIEMSLVLVVIGLIIGGVVAGNSLIKQSKIVGIATDAKTYTSAVTAFQQKYNALPGDMATATDLWGTNANCGTYAVGTGTQTCNGNGDGHAGSSTDWMEGIYLWQHLANAGLITGTYSGASQNQGSGGWYQPGYNIPVSKIKGEAGYAIRWVGTYTADASTSTTSVPNTNTYYAGVYGHILEAGAQDNTNHADPYLPILSGAEALNFDQKFDDGKPGMGTIVVFNNNLLTDASSHTCASSTNHITATYNIANIFPVCPLLFITGF